MADNWEGSGYEVEASSGGGLWLRLKKKGDKARLRFVSIPYRWTEEYTDNTGKNIVAKKAAWLAIHKETINGQVEKSVVIFSSSAMVYGVIRDLHDSDDWGDPRNYDITVERSEESPAKYYIVTPIPKGMGPLSDEDKKLVADAGINWPQDCIDAIAKQAAKDGPTSGAAAAPTAKAKAGDDNDPFADE